MENRFGVKDFFMFLILGALVVLVLLAMRQFDRQWDRVGEIRNALVEQNRTLREIRAALERGVPVTGVASTQPAEQTIPAFERIAAARRAPDFAMGDRIVDAF